MIIKNGDKYKLFTTSKYDFKVYEGGRVYVLELEVGKTCVMLLKNKYDEIIVLKTSPVIYYKRRKYNEIEIKTMNSRYVIKELSKEEECSTF